MPTGQVKRQNREHNPAFIRLFEENPAERHRGAAQPENMKSKSQDCVKEIKLPHLLDLGLFTQPLVPTD
ncbi:MAG: hypothetical protein SFV22_19710 [Saprospiraceae bacterium]|nr:hypothetical protein [Saprospiraceae bacterium]